MNEYTEFIFVVVIILVAASVWWYSSTPNNLPPGPHGLPLLGCMYKLRPPTAFKTLHQWSKVYGPVMSFYQGTQLFVALSTHEAMQEALSKQGDIFAGKPPLPASKIRSKELGVLQSEGARWKEQRRFALSTLRDFGLGRPIVEPKIMFEAHEMISSIISKSGDPFDPQFILNTASSNVICSIIFGHRLDPDNKLKDYLDEITFRLSGREANHLSLIFLYPALSTFLSQISPSTKRAMEGRDNMHRFMQQEIDKARKTYDPTDGSADQQVECFVHAFDKASYLQQGEYFDQEQLLAVIGDLFLAGSDTTGTTMRWALFYMASNPEIQNRVHMEIVDNFGSDEIPGYADRVKLPCTEATLMEIQRAASVLPLSVMHRTVENTMLMGYNIPKNTWIAPLLWTVHHHPKYFPDPDTFDPAHFLDEKGDVRKNLPLIPFALGKRICLGESLARMELFIFFTALMQKFRFYFPTASEFTNARGRCGFLHSPPKYVICAEKLSQ